MTKLHFSKTRIVYWDSGASTLTRPANANTIPTGVAEVPDTDNQNEFLPYKLYGIKGSASGWHHVIQNHYGCYMTGAEINALFENSSSFTPTKMGFTVSHTIPLSRSATGSTSQLSFNNTILSLIYDLMPNYLLQPGAEFATASEYNIFFRTFDGLRYSDSKRNLLPKPDLIFKVPNAKTAGTTYMTRVGNTASSAQATTTYGKYADFEPAQTGMPDGHTQASLVNAYLPEFLQDNTNVKGLYPGENQDQMEHNLESYANWSTIHTSTIQFNEVFAALDARNFGSNFLNVAFPSDVMLLMNVVPEIVGPEVGYDTSTPAGGVYSVTNSPYNSRNPTGDSPDSDKIAQMFFSLTNQQKANVLHNDMFSNVLPKKFIKCLPIVDNTDQPVEHTICATITWNLEIDVTDRLHKEINPWKWEMVWPLRIAERRYDNRGKFVGTLVKEYMASGWPKRPLSDSHAIGLRKRYRNFHDVQPTNSLVNYNTTKSYIPTAVKAPNNDNGTNQLMPSEPFIDPTQWTPTTYNQLYTACFKTNNDIAPTVSHKKPEAGPVDPPVINKNTTEPVIEINKD